MTGRPIKCGGCGRVLTRRRGLVVACGCGSYSPRELDSLDAMRRTFPAAAITIRPRSRS